MQKFTKEGSCGKTFLLRNWCVGRDKFVASAQGFTKQNRHLSNG